jgi:hypothetical protein
MDYGIGTIKSNGMMYSAITITIKGKDVIKLNIKGEDIQVDSYQNGVVKFYEIKADEITWLSLDTKQLKLF